MNLTNSLNTALISLSKNKMRTALTSIGVIIGVASVIIMIGIGSSAQVAVREKILTFGTNAISIRNGIKKFSDTDLADMEKSFPQIKYITPVLERTVLIKFFNKNTKTKLMGVNTHYFQMNKWNTKSGSKFTDLDVLSYKKVVLLGNSVSRALFGLADPVGQTININNAPFTVIAVLEEKGGALSGRDFDDLVIVPYTAASTKIIGSKGFTQLYVAPQYENQIESTAKDIKNNLIRQYQLSQDQYYRIRIRTSKERLKQAEDISRNLSILLAGIAAISLIVGGIGIMNIMLVSVSERTREIGIRMAIGAKGIDILLQFLIESIMLSIMGGFAGIMIGLTVYYLIAVVIANWPFMFSWMSVVLSFIFSSAVGITFGYYPAKKASKLNPIDALRIE